MRKRLSSLFVLFTGAACLLAAAPGGRVSTAEKREQTLERTRAFFERDNDALRERTAELRNPFVWKEEEKVVEMPAEPEEPEEVAPPAPRPEVPDAVLLPLVADKFQVSGVMAVGTRRVLMTPAGKKVEGDVIRATVAGKTHRIIISNITEDTVTLRLNEAVHIKQLTDDTGSHLTRN
jgi:hypothetical protein